MDSPLPVQRTTEQSDTGLSSFWVRAFFGIFIGMLLAFLLTPGTIEGKSLAILHGLCAQQPTHSLYFGEQRLPFDSRMTGIYGGFAVASLYMFVRGRWRAGLIPPLRVLIAMVVFVLLLAIDGVNSTLLDLGMWHAYEPRNIVRLGTGLLTGTTLAMFVWMLVAQVGFAREARVRRAPVVGLLDLSALVAAQAAFGLIVYLRPEILRVPLTLMLLTAAMLAVSGLTLAFVLLLTRSENVARRTRDLAPYATIALVIALLIIGATGGGRFALEAWLDIDPTVQRGVED
jgi:uncharacterized membrane protein